MRLFHYYLPGTYLPYPSRSMFSTWVTSNIVPGPRDMPRPVPLVINCPPLPLAVYPRPSSAGASSRCDYAVAGTTPAYYSSYRSHAMPHTRRDARCRCKRRAFHTIGVRACMYVCDRRAPEPLGQDLDDASIPLLAATRP